jgi:hypothetical protein
MLASAPSAMVWAQDQSESLAAQARDPTASLTAFQIRYDWTNSLHNAPGEGVSSVVLQPIIPFKLGEQRHIARVTLPYITNAPDLSGLEDIGQNPVPPNYIPTRDKSGLGDTALLDLLIFDASWGRWGAGAAMSLPTASDDALGSGKWSLGPAVVGIGKSGKWQYGTLVTGLFSVAGDSGREDVSVATIQPFASYDMGGGWSVGLSELQYTYNLKSSGWVDVPIGGRVEKLVQIGSLPVRVYIDAEYNLKDDDIAPEWTFRFAFVPLL